MVINIHILYIEEEKNLQTFHYHQSCIIEERNYSILIVIYFKLNTCNTYPTSRFWLLFNNIFFDGNQVRHLLIHLSNSKFLNFFVLKNKPRVINPKMRCFHQNSVNIEIILAKQTIYRIVLKLKFFSRKIKVTEATV